MKNEMKDIYGLETQEEANEMAKTLELIERQLFDVQKKLEEVSGAAWEYGFDVGGDASIALSEQRKQIREEIEALKGGN